MYNLIPTKITLDAEGKVGVSEYKLTSKKKDSSSNSIARGLVVLLQSRGVPISLQIRDNVAYILFNEFYDIRCISAFAFYIKEYNKINKDNLISLNLVESAVATSLKELSVANRKKVITSIFFLLSNIFKDIKVTYLSTTKLDNRALRILGNTLTYCLN